jgi:hypothetical protein
VKQNEPLYQSSVQEAGRGLASAGLSAADVEARTARLRGVEIDVRRLPDSVAALAIFLDGGALRAYALPVPATHRVAVGTGPVLRPLLRGLRHARRYRALALSANRVALFEGGYTGLDASPRPGLPGSLTDVLGEETTQKEFRVRGTGTGGAAPAYYSHDGASAEQKLDLERFHRALHRILATELKDALPLVLVATEAHQAGLRAAGPIPGLLAKGVHGNPDHLSVADLHARAWPLVEQAIDAEEIELRRDYERAVNLGKSARGLDEIGRSAAAGRVRRLWLEADARVPGRVDPASGHIEDAAEDDVLEDLAGLVVSHGGEVLVVAADRMPAAGNAAAELR